MLPATGLEILIVVGRVFIKMNTSFAVFIELAVFIIVNSFGEHQVLANVTLGSISFNHRPGLIGIGQEIARGIQYTNSRNLAVPVEVFVAVLIGLPVAIIVRRAGIAAAL